MNTIEKLTELFGKFPGIGPRQSRRFVYYLLTRSTHHNQELADLIQSLKNSVIECSRCHRFFEKERDTQELCSIDSNFRRDQSLLMIVSRDVDLDSIEKSGAYKGLYFVVGGSIPILTEKPEERIRQNQLIETVQARLANQTLKEIILAMNVTPEGEHTGDYIERILMPIIGTEVKISRLGKGVSTGTELEYSDGDTLTYAFRNRS